jgi:hypothetical protein
VSYVIARWSYRERHRKWVLLFIIYYLYQQMHIDIYFKILNCITNAPTCFDASAPSYGSFDIAFAKVIKY